MQNYLVYILKCSDNSLYIGITNDIKKRLKNHNSKKGAKYTKNRAPVQIFKLFGMFDRSSALRLEYRLKQLTRQQKISLTASAVNDIILELGLNRKIKIMQNKEYVDLVNSENYPNQVEVPLDPPFVDDRGTIQNLWLGQSGSVTYIESKKGAVRARHKHSFDYHASHMITGSVLYTEKDDDGKILHSKEYKAGEMFFSRPKVWHEMVFLEDSKMITINNLVKNHENYEKDVVRESK